MARITRIRISVEVLCLICVHLWQKVLNTFSHRWAQKNTEKTHRHGIPFDPFVQFVVNLLQQISSSRSFFVSFVTFCSKSRIGPEGYEGDYDGLSAIVITPVSTAQPPAQKQPVGHSTFVILQSFVISPRCCHVAHDAKHHHATSPHVVSRQHSTATCGP